MGSEENLGRIKNFPLPRQYASTSIYFVNILPLPMGLLSAFSNHSYSKHMIWVIVPFTALVGWIFWRVESVGD